MPLGGLTPADVPFIKAEICSDNRDRLINCAFVEGLRSIGYFQARALTCRIGLRRHLAAQLPRECGDHLHSETSGYILIKIFR